MLGVGYHIVLAVLAISFLVYILARLITAPVQLVLKLAVNSIMAVVLLCILSMLGEMWSYHLPVNPVTVLIIAILGLPGLVLVAVLNFLFI